MLMHHRRRRHTCAKATNHHPIYTFAKHSFIINKSPFLYKKLACVNHGVVQVFTTEKKATTQLAKTAGGKNTLISLEAEGASRQTMVRQEWGREGREKQKQNKIYSPRPQKYLQVENNNKQVSCFAFFFL